VDPGVAKARAEAKEEAAAEEAAREAREAADEEAHLAVNKSNGKTKAPTAEEGEDALESWEGLDGGGDTSALPTQLLKPKMPKAQVAEEDWDATKPAAVTKVGGGKVKAAVAAEEAERARQDLLADAASQLTGKGLHSSASQLNL